MGRSLNFAAGFACLLWRVGAAAATLEVSVFDRDGQPAPDVVVTVTLPGKAVERRAEAKPGVMDQIDQQFVPEVLVVQVGDSVVFPNSDTVAHQVYSFSPPKRFALGLYRGRPYPPVVFDRPGLVVLGCNIHDHMVGYIFVTETPYFDKTDARGRLTLHNLPSDAARVVAWHPRFATDEAAFERTVTLEETRPATESFRLTRALLPPPKKRNDSRVRDY